MCRAFVDALQEMGYSSRNMKVLHTTVWLFFVKPFSPQSPTRTPTTDTLAQKRSQALSTRYRELTKGYTNSPDKLVSLWKEAPELFDLVLNMGKPQELFKR